MRSAVSAVSIVTFLCLGFFIIPGPGDVAPPASAHHFGDIQCPTDPEPVHDGVVQPGEYSENFFDERTKMLVYFKCSSDANRTLHVAMVSPWDGWTEIRLQTVEAWNGDFNAVRVSVPEASLEVVDGFVSAQDDSFVDDLSIGGSHDVIEPVALRSGEHFVYEFAVPLSSPDSYDSQFTSDGSFYFQVAYATLESSQSGGGSFLKSDLHVLRVGTNPVSGQWTQLDVSLPQGNEPGDPVEVLFALRGEDGRPLQSRPVTAFVQTAFGFLDLGTIYTNDQGVGSVFYSPHDAGDYLIGASHRGGSGFLSSVAWLRLVVTSPVLAPSLIPRDTLLIQTVIVLVVGGVWGSYAYSFFILRHAMRHPKKNPSEES